MKNQHTLLKEKDNPVGVASSCGRNKPSREKETRGNWDVIGGGNQKNRNGRKKKLRPDWKSNQSGGGEKSHGEISEYWGGEKRSFDRSFNRSLSERVFLEEGEAKGFEKNGRSAPPGFLGGIPKGRRGREGTARLPAPKPRQKSGGPRGHHGENEIKSSPLINLGERRTRSKNWEKAAKKARRSSNTSKSPRGLKDAT